MQLDTITELLQIPGYKVRHMVSCTGNRIELLLEREGERAKGPGYVQGVVRCIPRQFIAKEACF